jgi:N utilization substance protein B
MSTLSRNKEHHLIMTVIYDELNDFRNGDGQGFRDARELLCLVSGLPYDEISDFVKNTVIISLQKYGVIVEAYTPYLINWKWDRLPLLTQAILIQSYTHFHYVENVDVRVVINNAVELAKKYIDEKQGRFINAILQKVLKK